MSTFEYIRVSGVVSFPNLVHFLVDGIDRFKGVCLPLRVNGFTYDVSQKQIESRQGG